VGQRTNVASGCPISTMYVESITPVSGPRSVALCGVRGISARVAVPPSWTTVRANKPHAVTKLRVPDWTAAMAKAVDAGLGQDS
jgi:hypothetical protein